MILVFFVLFIVFFIALIPIVWAQQSRRERSAAVAICPKCGHDAKVYGDDTGNCTKCRAQLIRTPGGSLVVK
jgi:ribosomal protein S27E